MAIVGQFRQTQGDEHILGKSLYFDVGGKETERGQGLIEQKTYKSV